MFYTINPMYCTTYSSIKERAPFKLTSAIFNFTIQLFTNNHLNYFKVRYPISTLITIYIYFTQPHTNHIQPSQPSGQVGFGIVGRVTYQGHCNLPDINLTSSMSERKKSQAGAIVPPNLGGEEEYGIPEALTRDISIEDRNHWDLLGSARMLWESPEKDTSHIF